MAKATGYGALLHQLDFIRPGNFREMDALKRKTKKVIRADFGEDSEHMADFKNINFNLLLQSPLEQKIEDWNKERDTLHNLLNMMKEEIFESELDDIQNRFDVFKLGISGKLGFSEFVDKNKLHPIIKDKTLPRYFRGEFEGAVFDSFKEVEIMIREKGGFGPGDYGQKLVAKALDPHKGPLTDSSAVTSERTAKLHLYLGAIGFFKNPSSHRHSPIEDAMQAAEMIIFADLLLKMLEK